MICRNSTHLIDNNTQIDSKTSNSLYKLQSTTFYITVDVRLDIPHVTVNPSIFLIINNSAFLPGGELTKIVANVITFEI